MISIFLSSSNIEAQLQDLSNTFSDNSTGFVMNYPSHWQLASETQLDTLFSSSIEEIKSTNPNMTEMEIGKPIALLYPLSPSGANMIITYQSLSIPMSSQSYMNSSVSSLPSEVFSISNPSSVNISGINSTRVDVTDLVSDTVLTQIYLTKQNKGFIIQYPASEEIEQDDVDNINDMLSTIRIN
jgi:hypothetical protein